MPEIIDRFTGPYAFLSNFAAAPVLMDGETYPTVEHAYQAAKVWPHACATYRGSDLRFKPWRTIIREASTASAAKRLGGRAPLREDWEHVKVGVMRELLEQKFAPRTHYRELLLATGDATLIEGNTWGDIYWGMCRGRGTNMLGKLLMVIRDAGRVGASPSPAP
jgi:hypothetical protein